MIHIIHAATLYDILDAALENLIEQKVENNEDFGKEIVIDEITELRAKLDAYTASKPSSYNLKIFGLGN